MVVFTLNLPCGHFVLLMQWASTEKGVHTVGGSEVMVIDTEYHGELR